jgi:anti-sigma regulatory factor (Ser/Thr protein kinase)
VLVPTAVPVPRFRGRYAAKASSVAVMRGEVEAVARECGARGEELADVRLAVSEAATNAVVHGSAGPDARVAVTVELADTTMLVTISDDGPGLSPRNDSPGLGLGLFIIAAITGDLDMKTGTAGSKVHMGFPILRADAKQELDDAVRGLEGALVEQDRVSERLDRAVGTSSEIGAYARLRAAGEQVTLRQTQVDRSAPAG